MALHLLGLLVLALFLSALRFPRCGLRLLHALLRLLWLKERKILAVAFRL